MVSDKKIHDFFFSLEKNPELFSFRLDGFSLYFILRFNIEESIRSQIQGKEHIPSQNFSFRSFFREIIASIRNKINTYKALALSDFDSLNSIKETSSIFVCTSSNEKGLEMQDILLYFKEKNKPVQFIQGLYQKKFNRREYYDVLLPYFSNEIISLNEKEKNALKSFIIYLNKRLSIDNLNFDYELKNWEKYLSNIKYKKQKLDKYLKKAKCKNVFSCSLYTEPWVLMACFENSVKCIEVQHGVFTNYSIYYQSSIKPSKETLLMPDYILTMGEEWKNILCNYNYIYNDTNVFSIGTRGFEKVHQKSEQSTKLKDKVLIATQPGIYNISSFLMEFFEIYYTWLKTKPFKFVIRVHPRENLSNYQQFNKFEEIVEIQAGVTYDSYTAISESMAVIGATTMCLYEALSFGIPAISLSKYKGSIIQGNIHIIESVNDLFDLLNNLDKKNTNKLSAYLQPFNGEQISQFLN